MTGAKQGKMEIEMRAVGYFRVSDEDQVEGFSMDAQRRTFHDFCAQKGWEVVGTYDEEGRSAWLESSAKRPVFRQPLEDAQAGKFDVAVTHTLDRFSRNLRVMLDASTYSLPARRYLRLHHPGHRLLHPGGQAVHDHAGRVRPVLL